MTDGGADKPGKRKKNRSKGFLDGFGDVFDTVSIEAAEDVVADIEDQLQGAMVTPGDVEDALSGHSLPKIGTLDVDVEESTQGALERADKTVQSGEEVATVAIDHGEEAATVIVDTGGDVFEVAVEDGGELAVEFVAEMCTAMLEAPFEV